MTAAFLAYLFGFVFFCFFSVSLFLVWGFGFCLLVCLSGVSGAGSIFSLRAPCVQRYVLSVGGRL